VVGRRADVQKDVSNVLIRFDGIPGVKTSDAECTVSSSFSLSYDRSIASSKAHSPPSAI
jgi:hypothetical protein